MSLQANLLNAAPTAAPEIDAGPNDVVIKPRRGWIAIDWLELYRYRELFFYLVWRDIKVRYKQAMLGFAWAIFVPLLSMAIYSFIGEKAEFKQQIPGAPANMPYLLYVFCGLVPWLFLQRAMGDGGMALVNQQGLMTKVYLPRLYLPTSSVGSALVDMGISMLLMLGMGVIFFFSRGWTPSWHVVFLPLMLVLTMMAALGMAYLLSAAVILYRDLRFLIPFFSQFGLWLSAVVFPPEILGPTARNWLALNPLAGVISGWRSCILGTPFDWILLGSSIVLCPLLLLAGLYYFRRTERRFADIA